MTMDDKLFEAQVRALEPKLYRTAYAMLWNDADAADAMQESIIKAWRRLNTLKTEECFEPWVMRILINECRDAQRRNKRRPLPLNEAVSETASAPEAPLDAGLQDALHRLPAKFRLPLLLHHMDGYSLAEIAPMLHLPIGTVKGRLYQARKLLKTYLEKGAI